MLSRPALALPTFHRFYLHVFRISNNNLIHKFESLWYLKIFHVINQLFAMLLEVILREIRSIFNQTYLFIHFFAGKGIIYHLIAYDLKIEENVRNLCF